MNVDSIKRRPAKTTLIMSRNVWKDGRWAVDATLDLDALSTLRGTYNVAAFARAKPSKLLIHFSQDTVWPRGQKS